MQQLNCPICKKEYRQINPPRMLTMCGHTFCHKCIRTFVAKKKFKGYKIKCPLDNTIIQVEKPTPDLFPKNMLILKLVDKRKNQLNCPDQENQFLNSSTILSNETKLTNDKINEKQTKTCDIHNKPLQLFCVEDLAQVCTDCVIFGRHRLHRVQSIQKLKQEQNNCLYELKKIMNIKKQVENKISNQQIQNQVLDLLDNKKGIILREIQMNCNQIREYVNKVQKQLIYSLQIRTLQVGHRIKQKMRISKFLNSHYNEWQSKSNQIIKNCSIEQNFTDSLFETINNDFYSKLLSEGSEIIKSIQQQQKNLIENIQSEIQQFRLQNHLDQLKLYIQKCLQIKFQTIKIQLLEFKQQKKQKYQITKEQLQQINKLTNSPVKNLQKFEENIKEKGKTTQINSNYNNQFDEEESLLQNDNFSTLMVQSRLKYSEIKTPIKQSKKKTSLLQITSLKSIKPLSVYNRNVKEFPKQIHNLSNSKIKQKQKSGNSSQLFRTRSPTSISSHSNLSASMVKEFHPKYLSLIKQLDQDKIQLLDLSACEFKKENISSLIKYTQKCKNLRVLKLMRNGFDDLFIDEIIESLLHFQRVNLAQNKLTEECLVRILDLLIKNKDQFKLEYINFGQNRVVQRKNNKLVQHFKRMGVVLVL